MANSGKNPSIDFEKSLAELEKIVRRMVATTEVTVMMTATATQHERRHRSADFVTAAPATPDIVRPNPPRPQSANPPRPQSVKRASSTPRSWAAPAFRTAGRFNQFAS